MNMSDGSGDAEFDEFAAAGTVEVGEPAPKAEEKPAEEAKPEKRTAKRGPPKPASTPAAKAEAEAGEEEAGKPEKKGKAKEAKPEEEGEEGDEDEDADADSEEEGEEEEAPKKKEKKASDRIRELTRRVRERDRLLETTLARLDALEKGGLPNNQGGGKTASEEVPAPDPTDTAKYPLGHLDDRYIEDKLEWLTDQKATARADAALQRQQEADQSRAAQQVQQELLGKVDDLATRGEELYDDFQESVVEAGMRGDWDLSQATFEAAHEVDNGAQILYELSQDKKEASRVAKLSAFQQMKFVQERDAEIAAGKKSRKIPKAGAPPENTPRGANSKTQINPATDNLDDFEKQWERDEKGKN